MFQSGHSANFSCLAIHWRIPNAQSSITNPTRLTRRLPNDSTLHGSCTGLKSLHRSPKLALCDPTAVSRILVSGLAPLTTSLPVTLSAGRLRRPRRPQAECIIPWNRAFAD
jgi:hypothetical protein